MDGRRAGTNEEHREFWSRGRAGHVSLRKKKRKEKEKKSVRRRLSNRAMQRCWSLSRAALLAGQAPPGAYQGSGASGPAHPFHESPHACTQRTPSGEIWVWRGINREGNGSQGGEEWKKEGIGYFRRGVM